MMSFEFSEYFEVLFVVPLLFMLIGVALATRDLVAFFKKTKSSTQNKFPCQLLMASLWFVFILVALFPPFYHGIHLAFEKEDAQVSSSGEITEFRKSYGFTKFYYEDKVCFGCYVFIDDQKYFIMTAGDLEIGDTVTFSYLPKSRIILSIEKVEHSVCERNIQSHTPCT